MDPLHGPSIMVRTCHLSLPSEFFCTTIRKVAVNATAVATCICASFMFIVRFWLSLRLQAWQRAVIRCANKLADLAVTSCCF